LKRVGARGRFHIVDGQVVTLDDITAADYVCSDPLDLDHLLRGEPEPGRPEPPHSPVRAQVRARKHRRRSAVDRAFRKAFTRIAASLP